MKYLKNRKQYTEQIKVPKVNEGVENVNLHNTIIKQICEIKLPDPQHGDLKLSMLQFENNSEWISLPEGFKIWEESFNNIIKMIPLQEGANTHYVTIDTKFFTKPEFLRREGVHADGNFCVDPNFVSEKKTFKSSWGDTKPTWGGAKANVEEEESIKSSWGGASPKPTWGGAKINDEEEETLKSSWGDTKPSWGGARAKKNYVVKEDNSHVSMDWVLPYNITIPIGDYISEKKGGILTVSTEVGCQGWHGTFKGEILSEGAYDDMTDQLTDDKKVLFEKNMLYFMTSNTPHETLLIDKGKRRTFMRITLNHEYKNESMLSKL